MIVFGTKDEIRKIKLTCDKILCTDCILYDFCCKEMFQEVGPYKLKHLEKSKPIESILIAKGNDKKEKDYGTDAFKGSGNNEQS